MIEITSQGLYQPGTSPVHRLDPRVKGLVALVMVILAFAAVNWLQLLVVAAAAAWLVRTVPVCRSPLQQTVWRMRWLLLFTWLMHLLLSPGRTLLGTSWLSLDGMLSGLFVCLQMLLSVVFAVTMTATTSVDALAEAFGWFVRPLQKVGCRTDQWQATLRMTLAFLPAIHEEATDSAGIVQRSSVEARHRRPGRWTTWAARLQHFVLRLVERGEEIARDLAAGGAPPAPDERTPLFPLARHDTYAVIMLGAVTLCYSVAGTV